MTSNKVFILIPSAKDVTEQDCYLFLSSVLLMASFSVTYGDNDGSVYSLQCSWMNTTAPTIHERMNITAVLKMKNLSKGTQ